MTIHAINKQKVREIIADAKATASPEDIAILDAMQEATDKIFDNLDGDISMENLEAIDPCLTDLTKLADQLSHNRVQDDKQVKTPKAPKTPEVPKGPKALKALRAVSKLKETGRHIMSHWRCLSSTERNYAIGYAVAGVALLIARHKMPQKELAKIGFACVGCLASELLMRSADIVTDQA